MRRRLRSGNLGLAFGLAAPWLAVLLYLALTLPQLGLPGLHYDEAREAGVNAAEMLLRQDVHAFRFAGLQVGSLFLPLMVQDYIGALNVYLALPFLALFGITVAGLRLLGLACGLATLLLVWRLGRELSPRSGDIAALLLATSPSFLFWSRQGVFVTNVVAALAVAAVWLGVRWRRSGRPRYLYGLAILCGLGLWAKLLFIWVMGAMAGAAAVAWLAARRRSSGEEAGPAGLAPVHLLLAAGLLTVSLSPLILFNWQTAGTVRSILSNLGSSYYGVQNTAFVPNLAVRLGQLATLLRGDHFWYLGGAFANRLAPWLAAAIVALALLWPGLRRFPLLLYSLFCALLVLQSCFTVSDLFVTHYAILQPFLILLVALAAAEITTAAGLGSSAAGQRRWTPWIAGLMALLILLWMAADLQTDWRYHRALAQTGGHAAHSDASYELAQWLEARSAAQPLALDWGLDATLRFLTANRVQPLELFGYERLDEPDPGFADRLAPFLADPDRLYLLHTAENTVFRGRRQALERLAAGRGLVAREEMVFYERSGRPLYVALRLNPR